MRKVATSAVQLRATQCMCARTYLQVQCATYKANPDTITKHKRATSGCVACAVDTVGQCNECHTSSSAETREPNHIASNKLCAGHCCQPIRCAQHARTVTSRPNPSWMLLQLMQLRCGCCCCLSPQNYPPPFRGSQTKSSLRWCLGKIHSVSHQVHAVIFV